MGEPSAAKQVEILVIQPDVLDPLDRLMEWLDHEALKITLVKPFEGDKIPTVLLTEGLIVLGGSMNANADEIFPCLEDIRNLYRQAVAQNIPALGICLGAQILATAFGGQVTVGAPEGPEYGVVEVEWTQEAEADEIFRGLHEPFLACAFHFDGITQLPSTAVRLGTGNRYPNQAFRQGSAWGVQFHPEVSPKQFELWLESAKNDDSMNDWKVEETLAEIKRVDSTIQQHQQLLAQRFVQKVLNDVLTEASTQ